MISVGGSNPDKELIFGSNYGYQIDLLAPAGDPSSGVQITKDQFNKPILCKYFTPSWNETFTVSNDRSS